MSIKQNARSLIAALLCAGLLTGCADTTSGSSDNSVSEPASDSSDSAPENTAEPADTEQADSTSEASAPESGEPPMAAPDTVRVAALSGPTAMGMTKLMEDADTGEIY